MQWKEESTIQEELKILLEEVMKQKEETLLRRAQLMLEKQEEKLVEEARRTQQEYMELVQEAINRGIQKSKPSRIGGNILADGGEERNEGLRN